MIRAALKEQIKEYRKTLTISERNQSYTRIPRWRYPFAAESKFYSLLAGIFSEYTLRVEKFIKGTETQDRSVLKTQDFRTDAVETDISNFFDKLKADIDSDFAAGLIMGTSAAAYVNSIMVFLRRFDEGQLREYMQRLLGSSVPFTTDWWDSVSKNWADNLAKRIKANLDEYAEKVHLFILKGYQKGILHDELIQQLKLFDNSLTDSRASFIARDLTGSLNSEVNRNLQMGIGISLYLWKTMGDERVRGNPAGKYPNAIPNHYEMQDLVCSWHDSTVISYDKGKNWVPKNGTMPLVHAGDDWGCRCISAPYDLDLIKQIDSEIEGENNGETE